MTSISKKPIKRIVQCFKILQDQGDLEYFQRLMRGIQLEGANYLLDVSPVISQYYNFFQEVLSHMGLSSHMFGQAFLS